MTRKHFKMIAKIINSLGSGYDRRGIAQRFVSWLSTTNPRFDEKRFVDACMGRSKTIA